MKTAGRNRARALWFTALSAPLWLVPLFLGLENWERHRAQQATEFASSPKIQAEEKNDRQIYRETAANAARPPAALAAAYPVLEKLDTAGKAGYKQLAHEWGALILDCNTEGRIRGCYGAPHPANIAGLAAKVSGLATLAELVPNTRDFEFQDIEGHFRRVVSMWRERGRGNEYEIGGSNCTHYKIPVDNDPHAGYQFMFHPMREESSGKESVAAVILPWRWSEFCQRYRPNCYLRNWYTEYAESEWWTNSAGFRDEEIVLPKPPGLYRIVCIGGSTTIEGPRNDLTYPNELERMLRGHFGTKAIEVVNCGVDGHSLGTTRGRFGDYLALDPDLIVHYNFVNDAAFILDDAVARTAAPNGVKHKILSALSHSRFYSRRCQILRALFMPGAEDYRDAIRRLLLPHIEAMETEAAGHGVRFAVASFAFPDFGNLPAGERAWFRQLFVFQQTIRPEFEDYVAATKAFNACLQEFCEEKGVLYVPVAEELKGGVEIYTDIAHMHVNGIRRKAEIMFEHLKEVAVRDRM